VRASKSRKIGVIGTESTIRSGSYTRALRELADDVEVYTRACPLFVPLAEEGWVDNEVAEKVARLYLASLRHSGIDALVLGCTHYPLLREVIGAVMGTEVELIDSARATAESVRDILRRHDMDRAAGPAARSFFVTDSPDRFVKVGARFLGAEVDSAVQIERRGTGYGVRGRGGR
jgi:glutamate racemase